MNPNNKSYYFNPNDVVILYSSDEEILPSGYYILKQYCYEILVDHYPFSPVTGNYVGYIPKLYNSYIKRSKDECVNEFIILLEDILSKKKRR